MRVLFALVAVAAVFGAENVAVESSGLLANALGQKPVGKSFSEEIVNGTEAVHPDPEVAYAAMEKQNEKDFHEHIKASLIEQGTAADKAAAAAEATMSVLKQMKKSGVEMTKLQKAQLESEHAVTMESGAGLWSCQRQLCIWGRCHKWWNYCKGKTNSGDCRCNKGKFASVDSSDSSKWSCAKCPTGKYKRKWGCRSTACTRCGVGRYGANEGIAYPCAKCAPGQYQPAAGTSACSRCPGGKYQNAAGKGDCKNCIVGKYSGSGANNCVNCKPGYYQELALQASCKVCPDGWAQSKWAQSGCEMCETGKYAAGGAATCKACEPGKVQPSTGQGECISCPLGKYQDGPEEEICDECDAGYYADTEGTVTCKACEPGFYSGAGASGPTGCPTGKYQPSAKSVSCMNCTECDVGEGLTAKCTKTADVKCDDCPSGKYKEEDGNGDCTSLTGCGRGKFTYGESSSAPGECKACEEGYFKVTEGPESWNDDCEAHTNCVAGQWVKVVGTLTSNIQCGDCPAGKNSQVDNAEECDTCSTCEAGRYVARICQVHLNAMCSTCPDGKYSEESHDSMKKSNCKKCEAGFYMAEDGATKCVACPAGYNSVEGMAGCGNCPEGKYRDAEVGCADCPVGTFQDAPGGSECKKCPAGSITKKEGQEACVWCKPGKYQTNEGESECLTCPAGRFSVLHKITQMFYQTNADWFDSGPHGCPGCMAGFYQPKEGMSGCTPCDIGKYSDRGQSECTECPEGKYQNVIGEDDCKACDDCDDGTAITGKCTNKANTTCGMCAAGQYSDQETTKGLCSPCLPGFFAEDEGAGECVGCPTGYMQKGEGGDDCDKCDVCAAGQYEKTACTNTIAAVCENCPVGRYTWASDAEECEICGNGKYADTEGATGCKEIPEGQAAVEIAF